MRKIYVLAMVLWLTASVFGQMRIVDESFNPYWAQRDRKIEVVRASLEQRANGDMTISLDLKNLTDKDIISWDVRTNYINNTDGREVGGSYRPFTYKSSYQTIPAGQTITILRTYSASSDEGMILSRVSNENLTIKVSSIRASLRDGEGSGNSVPRLNELEDGRLAERVTVERYHVSSPFGNEFVHDYAFLVNSINTDPVDLRMTISTTGRGAKQWELVLEFHDMYGEIIPLPSTTDNRFRYYSDTNPVVPVAFGGSGVAITWFSWEVGSEMWQALQGKIGITVHAWLRTKF